MKESHYGPTVLRAALGLLFIVPGVMKLLNPAMITGLLTNLGFPAPNVLAWVLLVSEIVFGLSVLVGWQVRYTVWPLVVVLVVATATVFLPNISTDPNAPSAVLFHLLGIAGLVSLALSGPGELAVPE